jgi:hypothetical protein
VPIRPITFPITMATSSQTHDSARKPVTESLSSSTRPIINNSFDYSTTATMSDINGKAPINGASAPRSVNEPIIKVQPPRREDLQPSYAKVIQADDQDAGSDGAGWYGSMVRFFVLLFATSLLLEMKLAILLQAQMCARHSMDIY